MRWHGWLGCGLVACSVAVGGCVSTDQVFKPSTDVDLSHYNEAELFGVNVARAQLPEARAIGPATTTNLQDAAPHDVGNLLINGIPAARIRAVVNTEAVTDEEVKAACYPMLRHIGATYQEPERGQKQLEVFKQTLDQIVEREAVLQVAFARLRKNGGEKSVQKLTEIAEKEFDKQWVKPIMEGNKIKTEAEFKEQLKAMNISLPMMKRQWTRNFMAQEFVRQSVYGKIDKIGHPQMEAYYTQHPEEFQVPDGVQWEDVFVAEALHGPRAAARQRAEMVLTRMRNGESVQRLLQDKLDDGDSSLRDGRGLGRKHGDVKPGEAEGPLFQLKNGEATIVEIGSGYHVVRVVQRDYAGMMSLDDPKVQKQITLKLKNEIGQREMKKMVSELRKQAVVEYFTN
jgi:hypothetical protein